MTDANQVIGDFIKSQRETVVVFVSINNLLDCEQFKR